MRKCVWVLPWLALAALALDPAKLTGKVQKQLKDFGYGSNRCTLFREEDKDTPVVVSGEQIGWLALARRTDQTVLLLLENHAKDPVRGRVRLNLNKLGFTPERVAQDLTTRQNIPLRYQSVVVGTADRPQNAEQYFLIEFLVPPGDRPVSVLIGAAPRR